ncbi:MAG: sugar phosphate isomerase/epimerase [Chloroflexota bacterium]|nr:sugar phosphate isomerase/epimerase [Chloroflexota bacterium]
MKVGVLAVLFGGMEFEEALDYIKSVGCGTVEIGCGGYPGDAHCKPAELIQDDDAVKAFQEAVTSRGLEISALSCHGNPIHPNPEIAQAHHEDFENTVLLAEKLGLDTVITFSGCPGGGPEDKTPNWVTCPWPPDYSQVVKWQWEEKLIPYWQETASWAAEHGVTKIALEMHPGFCVYNPETLLKLREAVGSSIGANFDPSHLFWQGIDPVYAIREIGEAGAMFHFHAKDTKVDPVNTRVHGVLDTKPYTEEVNRAWIFRTVGYGHSEEVWRDMISNLRLIGYDGALSIEHEDSLMSAREGFEKAVKFLKRLVIEEEAGVAYWA